MKIKIFRRLLPLYISAFLQGFVLWYAIEKLFMITIGFNNITTAVMVVTYLFIMLLVEIPSGLLADRWSRKGVAILSGLSLAISSLIGGISTNVPQYLISTSFFGIFFALYSGVYDSIVFDTLMEEEGNSDNYELYYSRIRLMEGLSLVVASVLGGLIGQIVGLRQVYLLTTPTAIISLVFLWRFKEPKLHLSQEYTSIRSQAKSTFSAITKKGIVTYLLLTLVFAGVVSEVCFEFNQLWLIALAAPVLMYGPINAIIFSSVVIGSGFARFFSRNTKLLSTIISTIFIGCGLALVFVKNIYSVALSTFIIEVIFISYSIIFNKQLHDRLSASVRAGALSAVSSITRILFIPVALLFGFIGQQYGIFNAAWVLFAIILITAVLLLRTTANLRLIK